MAKSKKTIEERVAEADARGGDWLARGNEHAEAGRKEKAEACYAKVQYWLDLSNNLRGCGESLTNLAAFGPHHLEKEYAARTREAGR